MVAEITISGCREYDWWLQRRRLVAKKKNTGTQRNKVHSGGTAVKITDGMWTLEEVNEGCREDDGGCREDDGGCR